MIVVNGTAEWYASSIQGDALNALRMFGASERNRECVRIIAYLRRVADDYGFDIDGGQTFERMTALELADSLEMGDHLTEREETPPDNGASPESSRTGRCHEYMQGAIDVFNMFKAWGDNDNDRRDWDELIKDLEPGRASISK